MNLTDEQKIEEIYSLSCGRIIRFSHEYYQYLEKFNILIYKDINTDEEKQIHCMTINSKISNYQFKTDKKSENVLMQLKDYGFLDRDSYIYCVDIVPILIKEIVSQYVTLFLKRNKNAKISRKTRNDILQVVENSRKIDQAKKNKIILGLKSVYKENDDVPF